MVFQETSLIPTLTVAQNLYLGKERLLNRLRGVYISAQQFFQSLNFDVDPTACWVPSLGAAKKADGRDRARRSLRRPDHYLRRTDRLAHAGGKILLLRVAAASQAARRVDHLHLARAGRGARCVGPDHGSARWSARDHGRHQGTRSRQDHPRHGRAHAVFRPLRSSSVGAAVSPQSSVGRESDHGADGTQHIVLDLCRADHRNFRPGGVRPHRDGEGRGWSVETRPVPRWPHRVRGRAGAVSYPARGGPGAASPMSPKTASSKVFSRP